MRTLFTVVFSLLLLNGCATFGASVSTDASVEDRLALGGSTLACAGKARQLAIGLGVGAAGASSLAGALATAATTSPSSTTTSLVALSSLGLGLTSVVLSGWAFVEEWNATLYDQRAGEVMQGSATEGCR